MQPSLFPWWERALLRLVPGYCPLCLGHPLKGLPWCERCYQAVPSNMHACELCAEPLDDLHISTGLCERCAVMPGFLHQVWAPLLFSDEVAALVHRYKGQGHIQSGRLLLELALSRLADQPAGRAFFEAVKNCDALLPVPPDKKRQRERGFDHVEWLAKRLGRVVERPLMKAHRQFTTGSQRGLSRSERWHNLKGVFALEKRSPARLMIVDDVITTGATMEVLARVAFARGAEWVGGFALARTPG